MKKRIIAAVMATLVGLSMVGCGSTSSDNSSQNKTDNTDSTAQAETSDGEKNPVTIRFYNYALSETAKADWWENTIANFEKENDWIDIETVTVDYNSIVSTFTNDIASGLSVDMIYGEVSWIPALAEAGFIQQPSQVLSKDFYDGYYDYVLDQFMYNGEVYGVPHYYTNSVIYVNKDLVEAAGLSLEEFPDTLDGLKEWIETLSDYYKSDDSISTIFGLTTAEVPATGSNINAIYTAFGAGNVCMYVDSSWGYAQIGEVDTNAANFTRAEALPTTMGTNGKGNSLVESHCFLLGSSLTDEQKEAIDLFVQYCTSTDTMQEYLNNIGLAFPAHKNMEDCQISPILADAQEGVSHVVKQPMIASLSSVQVELATMVLNYVSNGMSEEDAINNYISQAEYYINQ